jgi:hypothetical protein
MKQAAVLFLFISILVSAHSQDSLMIEGDSVVEESKPHSPKKATLLSAFLPGAGQMYNKKAWKVPIIYGGLAGAGYAIYFNRTEYLRFRDAYRLDTDGDSTTSSEFAGIYDPDYLQAQRDFYRGNMEVSYIIGGVVYLLQILAANVDAHMMEFDVSDDLTMKIRPNQMRYAENGRQTFYNGVKLTFNF